MMLETPKAAVKGLEGGGDKKPARKQLAMPPAVTPQYDEPGMLSKMAKRQVLTKAQAVKKVPLFAHLRQFEPYSTSVTLAGKGVHPAIVWLGLQYASGHISGATARATAFLHAFKAYLHDYKCSPNKNVKRDLDAKIRPLIQFLDDCRPKSISMGNAIKYIKSQIYALPETISENEARELLLEKVETFLQEKIVFAGQVIADRVVEKIVDGDVILTYGSSHIVEVALKKAFDAGRDFQVIVVDSRPKLEGKQVLRKLVGHGIKCTYMLITSISYIMKQVSKVLVGAYTLLANGNLMSRVGTASLALMANTQNVPVIVAAETFKFTDRAHLESISFNELGDPEEVVWREGPNPPVLSAWRDIPALRLLNLRYDVTPMALITMVATEHGCIPPTSATVIVREYSQDLVAS